MTDPNKTALLVQTETIWYYRYILVTDFEEHKFILSIQVRGKCSADIKDDIIRLKLRYSVWLWTGKPCYWDSDQWFLIAEVFLTHWGRMTHICVGNVTIIGADNGLSPYQRQAVIWTNAEILLIGHFGTNFSEISIKILLLSFTKMRLKVSSANWRPFCLGFLISSALSG